MSSAARAPLQNNPLSVGLQLDHISPLTLKGRVGAFEIVLYPSPDWFFLKSLCRIEFFRDCHFDLSY